MNLTRRNFIKRSSFIGLAGIGLSALPGGIKASDLLSLHDEFTLTKLPYGYDALEPHIDKMTMEIHHDKHHQGYVNNLNKAVSEGNIHATLDELVRNASKYSTAIRNNAGGHWNHSFFWEIMKPGGSTASGKILEAINSSFGSMEDFKKVMEDAGKKRFGSGWAWLVSDKSGKLSVGSTPNQDNPMMDLSDFKGVPILGVDVWEHAYYLKYQNKRGDYLTAWWNVVNWDKANDNYEKAMSK